MQLQFFRNSAFFIVLCAPLLAQADIGIYAKAGTQGVGGGIGYGLSDSVTARVGYTALNYDRDIETDDVDYDGEIKLGGGEAMLDWHPFNGSFRLTGGLILSRNKIDVDAELNEGVTINGITYNAGDLGDLSGDIEFKSTTPYLGIGWGNVVGKNGNLHFVMDLGVQFLGSPDVSLNASCSAQGLAQAPAECAELDRNVQAEEDELNDDAESFQYWPVINIGLAYRF